MPSKEVSKKEFKMNTKQIELTKLAKALSAFGHNSQSDYIRRLLKEAQQAQSQALDPGLMEKIEKFWEEYDVSSFMTDAHGAAAALFVNGAYNVAESTTGFGTNEGQMAAALFVTFTQTELDAALSLKMSYLSEVFQNSTASYRPGSTVQKIIAREVGGDDKIVLESIFNDTSGWKKSFNPDTGKFINAFAAADAAPWAPAGAVPNYVGMNRAWENHVELDSGGGKPTPAPAASKARRIGSYLEVQSEIKELGAILSLNLNSSGLNDGLWGKKTSAAYNAVMGGTKVADYAPTTPASRIDPDSLVALLGKRKAELESPTSQVQAKTLPSIDDGKLTKYMHYPDALTNRTEFWGANAGWSGYIGAKGEVKSLGTSGWIVSSAEPSFRAGLEAAYRADLIAHPTLAMELSELSLSSRSQTIDDSQYYIAESDLDSNGKSIKVYQDRASGTKFTYRVGEGPMLDLRERDSKHGLPDTLTRKERTALRVARKGAGDGDQSSRDSKRSERAYQLSQSPSALRRNRADKIRERVSNRSGK